MEEVANVYARSLCEAATDAEKVDDVREQVGELADALDGDRDLQVFLFSPYFSTEEKKEGLHKAISGADDLVRQLPRPPGGEPPDAGAVPDPQGVRPALGSRRTSACRWRSPRRSSSTRR